VSSECILQHQQADRPPSDLCHGLDVNNDTLHNKQNYHTSSLYFQSHCVVEVHVICTYAVLQNQKGRGNSVGIGTGSISGRVKTFIFLTETGTGSGAHPAQYLIDTEEDFAQNTAI
jgi:hypothetical protein